ncbi:hypothetical protein [Candidatus Frankia nodulisporulans]|uniref:hypothetical protein n=1 Tax=Candidatus Frankia nodulisporulans TaxID=2060052 RepID=UPI001CDC1C35|nr:hypothetical protein [Candidatus Frankia nodulisporulans]
MIRVGPVVFAAPQFAEGSLGTASGECGRGPHELTLGRGREGIPRGDPAGFDAVLFQKKKGDQKSSGGERHRAVPSRDAAMRDMAGVTGSTPGGRGKSLTTATTLPGIPPRANRFQVICGKVGTGVDLPLGNGREKSPKWRG